MEELWQLYDEGKQPLINHGATKDEIFNKGLLHGASPVWIWRTGASGVEILLQKRASNKRTWPDRYDISASGHIDLSENPLAAARRETEEEIGPKSDPAQLTFIDIYRAHLVAPDGSIENEWQWLYLFRLSGEYYFSLQALEVAQLEWKSLDTFVSEVSNSTTAENYVPHGSEYYTLVVEAIRKMAIMSGQG